jgi:putative PIN family toxin of toxin-antitoxin system
MPKAVIDTNILVSAFLSQTGKPAQIVELFQNEQIEVFYSNEILAEYEEVLCRERFQFDRIRVFAVLDDFQKYGGFVCPPKSSFPLIDEDDRMFYDAAICSGACLVTGNTKHYPKEPFVVTAAKFLVNCFP